MIRTISHTWNIKPADYHASDIRKDIDAFLSNQGFDKKWRHRLLVIACELIANACMHAFKARHVIFAIKCIHYSYKSSVHMNIEDDSKILLKERYDNLAHAVQARRLRRPYQGIHGRGLHIIVLWTDRVQFSKKRTGGLKGSTIKDIITKK